MSRSNATLFSVAPFTMVTLTVNLVMYAIAAARSQNLMLMDSDVLASLGASQREALWVGGWNHLVAPMFLHGGLLHLGMNMYYLWQAGPDAEVDFGTANFASIYLLSGLTGVCLSQICGGYLSIGASGCLCGIMGARLAVLILQCPVPRNAWRSSAVRTQTYSLLFLLGIGILGLFHLDNWAHFGGMVTGLAMGLGFELWRRGTRTGKLGVYATLLAAAALICAARWTVFNPTYHIFQCAVARQNHDVAAATFHTREAQKWARRWEPMHFLGVLNPTETDAVLQALALGLWDAKTALDPSKSMLRICARFKHGFLLRSSSVPPRGDKGDTEEQPVERFDRPPPESEKN